MLNINSPISSDLVNNKKEKEKINKQITIFQIHLKLILIFNKRNKYF